MQYDRYVTSLDGLPIHARPPEEVGPFGESETRESQRPGNGTSHDEELTRGYERGRWTPNASYKPRSSCTQGSDILGSRST